MKHGIKLTLKEKKLLQQEGYNPKEFLRVKRTSEHYEFLQIHTRKILIFRR